MPRRSFRRPRNADEKALDSIDRLSDLTRLRQSVEAYVDGIIHDLLACCPEIDPDDLLDHVYGCGGFDDEDRERIQAHWGEWVEQGYFRY